MPPKPKFEKSEIVAAALALARRSGMEGVTARAVGDYLGCSARPIFTFFDGMEALQEAVREEARRSFLDYLHLADDYVPAFKMRGLQMIAFAQEEPQLFRILFLSRKEPVPFDALVETYAADFDTDIPQLRAEYGLSREDALLLFSRLWVQSCGICTLCAAGICTFTRKQLSAMLGQVFAGTLMLIENGRELSMAAREPVLRSTPESSRFSGGFPGLTRES